MPLAEGVSARIAYKAYASGAITPNAQAVSSSDLGASSAQELRRVSSTLSLSKDTYQSNEIRSDRQIADFRHGVRRAQGNIQGELSAKTYGDFFAAVCRGDWASAITATESDFTSVAADSGTAKLTFGGGNPVTKGYRVGDIVRFTNLSETANNARNFLILAFGGTSNREVTVYPAPTTMTADSAFNMTGFKTLSPPDSGHVSRKFGIEIYGADIDVARLFTECRIGQAQVSLPASGNSTVSFDVMGRGMEVYEGGAAPFFTSPTGPTGTRIMAAVNGLLRLGGSTIGVVTALDFTVDLSPSSDPVVGQNFVPEIFLGRFNLTGTMRAMFQDATMLNYFVNETEVELLAFLTGSSDAAAEAMSFYMPRVKLGGSDVETSGEGGQGISLPFQALKYTGSAAGVAGTTLRICDTEIA